MCFLVPFFSVPYLSFFLLVNSLFRFYICYSICSFLPPYKFNFAAICVFPLMFLSLFLLFSPVFFRSFLFFLCFHCLISSLCLNAFFSLFIPSIVTLLLTVFVYRLFLYFLFYRDYLLSFHFLSITHFIFPIYLSSSVSFTYLYFLVSIVFACHRVEFWTVFQIVCCRCGNLNVLYEFQACFFLSSYVTIIRLNFMCWSTRKNLLFQ